jgi:anti-anti-sigma regulatory factor
MRDTSLHRIVVPAQINAAGLPAFLELLGQPVAAQTVCLDFARLRRVSPAGMVALVASVTRWQRDGRRVLFENLETCAITGYLQRMDVLSTCGVQLPEYFKRHESAGRFMPVQLIEHPVDALGHAMAVCVAPGGDELDQPLSALYDLVWYVLTETANNARQHSGGTGYASAQVTRSEGFVRLAIADNGKGILQSFRDAGLKWSLPMDDPAAIRKALEPFVSSKGTPTNEGVGLTLVSGLARLTKAMLLIVSGRGMLTMDGTGNIRTQLQDNGAVFQGTLLALTIPQNHVQDFASLLTAAKVSAGLLQTPGSSATFAP